MHGTPVAYIREGTTENTTKLRSAPNCTPLDEKSWPLLLTSTLKLPDCTELGSIQRKIVDVTASVGTVPPCPKLTVQSELTLKCDPRTVTRAASEMIPLDGVTLVTVGRASYTNSSGFGAMSIPLTLTSTNVTVAPAAGGDAHSMASEDRTFAAATCPPNRHSMPCLSKFLPTTVTLVPPCVGPTLGCSLCTLGDETY